MVSESIRNLVAYVVDGRESPGAIGEAIALLGGRDMRVVAINLLGWMGAQTRLNRRHSLRIDKDYAWCHNLKELVDTHQFLSDVIEHNRDTIMFHHSLADQDVFDASDYVNANYRPALMK